MSHLHEMMTMMMSGSRPGRRSHFGVGPGGPREWNAPRLPSPHGTRGSS